MTAWTHICLVSAQPSPTLAPLFDSHFPPDKVVLVVTPEQQSSQQIIALEQLLSEKGIANERLETSTAWDAETVEQELSAFLQNQQSGHFLLNATGGTKPLSIGAFLACYNQSIPIYYVNLDKLNWLYRPDALRHELVDTDLTGSLDLRDLLAAHSVRLLGRTTRRMPEGQLQITRRWLQRIDVQQQEQGMLNRLAADAVHSLSVELSAEQIACGNLQTLLEELQGDGLLTLQGRTVKFRDEQARFFTNGGWLEDLVWHELEDLRTSKPELGIQEVARNIRVDIKAPDGHAEQEIDIALIARNRLYVIECKTANLAASGSNQSKADEALFRLAAIQDKLGGLQTRGMVVSFRKVRGTDKSRAATLKLSLVDALNLKTLRGKLCDWLR